MQLSPEREAELIEENMPKIYRSIDNFMARCDQKKYVQISYDDCVQEVSLAFLEYIRRCKDEEQLIRFPWYDAIHALTELVLRHQPFSVPISTKLFSSIMRSLPATVSFDVMVSKGLEVDGLSKQWVPDMDTKIDFEAFMSGQEESVQRIASMRMYGMTQRDIASQYGVCKHSIDRKITKLREDYDDFIKGDEDDE